VSGEGGISFLIFLNNLKLNNVMLFSQMLFIAIGAGGGGIDDDFWAAILQVFFRTL
jgi:hypothetical protein